ncbi:MAG: hypothetical protein KBT88_13205 [Gammaproteobacteria bacterium]|nr:hypothetical protein [Gammaproteobacteria bacterium]MBQ0840735.1 hypothetical protein [Gammaproteobacteria bacterium]
MSDNTPDNNVFEPIKPADIPLSQPVSETPDSSTVDAQSSEPGQPPRRWVIGAILVALACVLLLFFVTVYPPKLKDSEQNRAAAEQANALTPPPALEESPFQKAQLAAARRTAQDILARVLEKQRALKAQHIQQWAGEEYQQALSAANEGDQRYREREFKTAIEHYQAAEALLDKLEAGREPYIAQLLDAGLAAINQGQNQLALQAFEQILLLAPEHPQALEGQQRSVSLAEVFAATELGKTQQAEGHYRAALVQYDLALSLDPLFEAALIGRKEAQHLLQEEQFQAAINLGFQHLHRGELSTARQHLQRAMRIKPESPVAQNALTQVNNEIAQRAIARLLHSAQDAESKEQWQAALDTYNKILARDAAVTAATVGKIRSAARQQLDARLEKFIHQPLRLANPPVYRQAQQSLTDARQIKRAGQRLELQINALSQVLTRAQQPQSVVLRSDNLTRVSIFKLGEFAPFAEKTLQLKPGKYVAQGIRSGYRDVRVEFTVLGANTAPVVVQCRETI